jgi:hypothetical protein
LLSAANETSIDPSTLSTTSLLPLPWLIRLLITLVLLCLAPFVLLLVVHVHRQHRLRRKTDHYATCVHAVKSSDKPSVSLSTVNKNSANTKRNKYDDVGSMGSYIYPITSSTSLIQTSSPSSMFKSEQYAIIDSNTSTHWPMSNVRRRTRTHGCDTSRRLDGSLRLVDDRADRQSVEESVRLRCSRRVARLAIDDIAAGRARSKQIDVSLSDVSVDLRANLSGQLLGRTTVPNNIDQNGQESIHQLFTVDSRLDAIDCSHRVSSRQRFLCEANVLSRLNSEYLACVVAVHLERLYLLQEHSQFGTVQDYFRTSIDDHTSHK